MQKDKTIRTHYSRIAISEKRKKHSPTFDSDPWNSQYFSCTKLHHGNHSSSMDAYVSPISYQLCEHKKLKIAHMPCRWREICAHMLPQHLHYMHIAQRYAKTNNVMEKVRLTKQFSWNRRYYTSFDETHRDNVRARTVQARYDGVANEKVIRTDDWLTPNVNFYAHCPWISGRRLHHTDKTNSLMHLVSIANWAKFSHCGRCECFTYLMYTQTCSARKRKTQFGRRIVHTHWINSTVLYQPFFCRHTHTQNVICYFLFVVSGHQLFIRRMHTIQFAQLNCEIIDDSNFFRFTSKFLSAVGNHTLDAMVGVCCISGFLKNLRVSTSRMRIHAIWTTWNWTQVWPCCLTSKRCAIWRHIELRSHILCAREIWENTHKIQKYCSLLEFFF